MRKMDVRIDIYSSVLKSSIHLILDHHKQLFDDSEHALLNHILALSSNALILFSRLLSRKYAWLRVDSFVAYLPDESDRETALNELIDARVLQQLQNDPNILFLDIWPACFCLNVDELKVFSTFITGGSSKAGSG